MTARLIVATLLVYFYFAPAAAGAAEFTIDPVLNDGRITQAIAMEGRIEPGDFDRFEAAVRRAGPTYNRLYLASKGGDLVEAIRIGRLVRELRYETIAPALETGIDHTFVKLKNSGNQRCLSACFFVFVAGVERSGFVLGIHRPYLSDEDYRSIEADLAIKTHRNIERTVSAYMREMSVSNKFVEAMLSVPPDMIEFLSLRDAQSLTGYVPEIEGWIEAQCPKMTPTEERAWRQLTYQSASGQTLSAVDEIAFSNLRDRQVQIWQCQARIMHRVTCEAWHNKYSSSAATCE